MNLTEAFKALDALNEDTFSVSDDGISKLSTFMRDDDDVDVSVIDPEAETEEDIQDSYVGKVILDCKVCHSKVYKDKEDIELDEEQTSANVGEECPYCYTTDGYDIIGEVASFENTDESKDDESINESYRRNNKPRKGVYEAVATMERPAKKDLTSIDGTIASVLNAHKEEIDACGMNMNAIKSCVTKILTSGEVKGDAAAQKAVMIINNCRNLSQLLSTLTGYMTGMNAITNGSWFQVDFKDRLKDKKVTEAVEYVRWVQLPDGKWKMWGSNPGPELDPNFLDRAREQNNIDYKDAKVSKNGEYPEGVDEKDIHDKHRFNESKSIKEGYRGGNDLDDILSWLQDHKQAWDDFCVYFEDVEDEDLTQDMVVDWIAEHDQLYNDFINYFYKDFSDLDESKSIKEDVNNVNVETDDSIVNVNTDDNGKVTVTTEPKVSDNEPNNEVIVPVTDETQTTIENGVESVEDEFVDAEFDGFDEEAFDGLGESYLKNVYSNVDSYKTEKVKVLNDSKLVVEGWITFTSGSKKKTSFLFEAKDCTRNGKYRFTGENQQLTRGKKAFTISGALARGKFITESFNYNYRSRDSKGKSTRIYGTLRNRKGRY